MKHFNWHRLVAALGITVLALATANAAHAVNRAMTMGPTSLSNVQALSQLGSDSASGKTITLGWTAWSDARFMIQLVKQQIEAHTDVTVHAQRLRIAVQYAAVAKGDIDGMVMAWLPDTHKNYWKKYGSRVVDLGPMYSGAIVGWAVPDYVPQSEVASIVDLQNPAIAKKFDNEIIGIDPGAGEMEESRKALENYGLSQNYTLVPGSDRTMTNALARAIQLKQPIVVTLWTPHWAWAKWNLRFLKDPQHEFGGAQHVDVIVREGFGQSYPVVAAFLGNIDVPLAKLQHAMYVAHETDESTAVAKFVNNNPDLIASWWQQTGANQSTN